jgi:hypothetical protein
LSNGTIVKASVLPTEQIAREIAAILDLLRHPNLTRALGQHGRALLTEWVDGQWPSASSASLIEECGAVLGSLNAVPPPQGFFRMLRNLGSWERVASRNLGTMVEAGILEADVAAEALSMAGDSAPTSCEMGFAHRDFCPTNLLVDREGFVRAIDNDFLGGDALDYDLARWWYRWPMPEVDRATFLRGYARHRSPATFERHFGFWMIIALTEAAVFHIRERTGGEDAPRAALMALLERPREKKRVTRPG